MSVTEALAEKGLSVLNGHLRLNMFLQVGATVMLTDVANGKTWELSLKDGEANLVESTRDPSTPGFVTIMVKSEEKMHFMSPKDLTQDPNNQRAPKVSADALSFEAAINIKAALAQKNLTVLDGARRLRLIAETGGTLLLKNEKGRSWQLTVKDSEAVIVDAIADPKASPFPPLWVEIGAKPPQNSQDWLATIPVREVRRNPANPRAARPEDDSPSP